MSDLDDPDFLLREGPWLRRLAGALVGDASRADDLTQEVLAAALVGAPPRGRRALRAWLRTVARRKSTRGREREESRREAEARAASPERVSIDASERLAAQEAVARALARVEDPYRTAVVLRYLDEKQPREIADLLGLSPTAARSRISRGVARLREELVREHGPDARLWSAVLIPLARPERSAVAAPAFLSSLAAIMSTKWFAAAFAVLAVVGTVLVVSPWAGRTAHSSALPARPGPVPAPLGLTAAGDEPDTARVDALDRPVAPSGAARRDAHFVEVLGPDGVPVPDASAAWVHASGEVSALELDEAGRAPRPAGAARGFFARAPGLPIAWCDLADGSATNLRLDAGKFAEGIVTEDGRVPLGRVRLDTPIEAPLELPRRTERALQRLGFEFDVVETHTRADGTFRLGPLPGTWAGTIQPASTHAFAPAERAERLEDGTWLLRLTRWRVLTGRCVVAETRAPAPGALMLDFEGEGGASMLVEDRTDTEGRFAIGIPPLPNDAMWASVNVIALGSPDAPEGGSRRVRVDSVSFPHDVGTIEVSRGRTLVLEVRSSDGPPIAGAHVDGPLGVQTTDEVGRASLSAAPGQTIELLAPGFRIGRFTVGDECGSEDEPCVVVLEPGPMLRIAPPEPRPKLLRLEWDTSPFPVPAEDVSPPRAYGSYQDGSPMQGWNFHEPGAPGFLFLSVPPFGDVEIPGLAPGARLRVLALDVAYQTFLTVPVELPEDGGVVRLDLESPDTRNAVVVPRGVLAIEARSNADESIPLRSVSVREGGVADPSVASVHMEFSTENHPDAFEDGRFEIGPLRSGELRLEITTEDGRTRTLDRYLFTGERDLLEVVF